MDGRASFLQQPTEVGGNKVVASAPTARLFTGVTPVLSSEVTCITSADSLQATAGFATTRHNLLGISTYKGAAKGNEKGREGTNYAHRIPKILSGCTAATVFYFENKTQQSSF